ncbi:hypothetical protein L8P35_14235 [Enterobacter cloacae]|uniref:hypothetical protein n=1 Tax=Enterobacter cloacae TaxID=550 RepID=UPI002002C61E|nr:hypothetical protein [Enterobacter cloacae]EKG3969987.1 hypothetical protein [Salmonella enterica]ELW4538330.1 hypothetical protein [Salmonella enterica]ELX9053632.1 hypothetical protein [Salmonella enterica]MCK7317857.1 hypothetical protein [Enterobacter cloacae]
MKLSKELGFIRECPDPVSLPEHKLQFITEKIYELLDTSFLYKDNLKYALSSIFVSSDNKFYINNSKLPNSKNDFFVNSVLDIKNNIAVDYLFLSFGRGRLEYIDIFDGPYIKAYNNYGYFMRYYAFCFWSEDFKHFDVMDIILLYIKKARMISFEKCSIKMNKEIILLGYKLLVKFNSIQAMKLVQLFYFYELESIADKIMEKLFGRIKKENNVFFNANNVFYLQQCIKSMIDLERVRINVANIYMKNEKVVDLGVNELLKHFNKIKREIDSIEVD